MTETQQSLEKTGVRAKSNQHLLKPHYKEAKKMIMSISFSALIFYIIFISISFLNITPSILFKDTKFWFFISNVIVVVIAVDSGAFSSRNGNHDLYEEFMINSKTRNKNATTTTTPTTSSSSAKSITKSSLEKKPMILYDAHKGNVQEEKIIELGDTGHSATQFDKGTKPRYNRSKSETSIAVVYNEDKRVLTRSKTENYNDKFEEDDDFSAMSDEELNKKRVFTRSKTENYNDKFEEEDEFSAMSDEELNKRVEEFIERFNRQIRLQDRTL